MHARDYVEMQWRMRQEGPPEDFVIATGDKKASDASLSYPPRLLVGVFWRGKVLMRLVGERLVIVVRIDPRYFRPAEVETLLGDPSKLMKNLVGSQPHL